MGYKQKLILLFSVVGLALIPFIVWLCWPVDEWQKKIIARNTWRSSISCYWKNDKIYLKNETDYPLTEVKIKVSYCMGRFFLVPVMEEDTVIISNISAETTIDQLCEIGEIDRFCGTSAGTEIISIYAPAFEFCYDEVKEKSNVEDKFRCR